MHWTERHNCSTFELAELLKSSIRIFALIDRKDAIENISFLERDFMLSLPQVSEITEIPIYKLRASYQIAYLFRLRG